MCSTVRYVDPKVFQSQIHRAGAESELGARARYVVQDFQSQVHATVGVTKQDTQFIKTVKSKLFDAFCFISV